MHLHALTLVGISFAGTFVWALSPEVAAAAYATKWGWNPLLIGLLAATGQGLAHVTLYFAGNQLRRRWRWFEVKCERAVVRHARWLQKGWLPLGLASGLLGIPPSSVTAALAPGLRLPGRALLPLMFVMRLIRLSAVAWLAAGGAHWLRQ